MPIAVVCSSCKARFTVSDKFAGKKGPCPKCKTILTVPDAPAEEVTVHVPDQFASGGKDSKGRSVSKPLARVETKIDPITLTIAIGVAVLVLAGAIGLRVSGIQNKLPLIALGLVVVAPPICAAGYMFLRDDEILDPFRGKNLWIRATLCGLIYAALWGVYYPLPGLGVVTGQPWQWLYVAPLFVCAGAGVSLALFELDFGSGALHYSFFVVVSLILRFALGLPPIWAAVRASRP